MEVKQSAYQTSKGLKLLLRLSIVGIFFVAGLGYAFNSLIYNLEETTKNTKLKLDILQKIETETLAAKYDFIKALSFIEEGNYILYRDSSIQKMENSNRYINIIESGGKINIGRRNKSEFYTYNYTDQKDVELLRNDLYDTILDYFPIFDEEMKEGISSDDVGTIIAIQKLISLQSEEVVLLFNDRLQNLTKISSDSLDVLRSIEKETNYKKDIYMYAQVGAIFSIIIILILAYRPIRKQIIKSSQELEDASYKAEQAYNAKSEFLANMSHEIRTPLNAILGFIELLKDKEKDVEKLQYIETIQDSSASLLGIINDILDFSKKESGNLSIDKVDFNVDKEFNTLFELFRAKASQKSINLKLVMRRNIPAALYADPLRIKQVIANLLSNAIKFTPQNGTVYLFIAYKNNKLQVAIKDSGIGIAKDKQELIFQAFSQAENSTTRKFGGTGLGLSISAKLVSMLGGELSVKSEEGKGSIFYFSIDAEVGRYKRIINNDIQDITMLKGKKILLVEDNKPNQMFMSLILKNLKLEYDIAEDGLKAIKAFKSSEYDLILMDENMPNLNGIEATKRILNIEEKRGLPHTPIIALTANALKGDREKFLSAGMDEYLTKPLDIDKLSSVLIDFIIKKEIA
jgi:signal transduction histidine kinase/ActR/RegA family two-component response regulator